MYRSVVFLFLLPAFQVFGQPVYPASDYAGVETSVLFSSALVQLDTMDLGIKGADVEWDYQWLPVDNQDVQVYQDPNTAGYKTSWCFLNGAIFNCNQAFNDHVNRATDFLDFDIAGFFVENPVVHYKLTDDVLEEKFIGATLNLGQTSVPGTIDLQDVDTIYRFPLTYGQEHRSTRVFEADLAPFGVDAYYVSNSERNSEIDGWGTLSTPFGQFDETLRMRTVVVGVDSVSFDTIAGSLEYQRVYYQWFAPGYPLPVLEFSGNIINGQEVILQTRFIDTARCLSPNAFFAFLPPNPVLDSLTESVTVTFSNLSTGYDSLAWFADGDLVSQDISPALVLSCGGPHEISLIAMNTVCMPLQADTFSLTLEPDATASLAGGNRVFEEERMLIAALDGVEYQWLACNDGVYEEVEGATNRTFALPPGGGRFSLAIETPNGCVDTSACVLYDASVGIKRLSRGIIRIYPNPARDHIIIRHPEGISPREAALFAMDGKPVDRWDLNGEADLEIPLNVKPGIYLLKVITDQGTSVQLITTYE